MAKYSPQQLHLPGMEPKTRKRNTNREDFPLLPGLTFSHSSWGTFAKCSRCYYLKGPGAWGGWDPKSPPQVRRRYLQKMLEGRFAWLGNRMHELIANRLFSQIDAVYWEKTGISPKPDEVLRSEFLRKLRTEWCESRSMTWRSAIAMKRLKKAAHLQLLWLLEHQNGTYPSGEFPVKPQTTDDRRRVAQDEKFWREHVLDWITPSLDRIFSSDWGSIVGTLNVDDWLVIEGHRLERGMIVPENPAERWKSQQMLREGRIFPAQKLTIDGREWEHHLTLDLLVRKMEADKQTLRAHDHKTGRVDWKTGGARESAKDQVKGYLASLVDYFPGATEDNLRGQLSYLQYPAAEGCFEDRLALGEARQHRLEIENRVRTLAERYVPLTAKSLELLRPELSVEAAKKLEAKPPENQLIALKQHFPAEAAARGEVSTCRYCEMRSCCPEGKRLVKLSGIE